MVFETYTIKIDFKISFYPLWIFFLGLIECERVTQWIKKGVKPCAKKFQNFWFLPIIEANIAASLNCTYFRILAHCGWCFCFNTFIAMYLTYYLQSLKPQRKFMKFALEIMTCTLNEGDQTLWKFSKWRNKRGKRLSKKLGNEMPSNGKFG